VNPRQCLELNIRGRTLPLMADTSVLAVTYDDVLTGTERRAVEHGLLGTPARRRYEVPGQRLTVVGLSAARAGRADAMQTVVSLNAQPEVERSQLLYRYGEFRVALTSRVLVKLRDPGIDAAAQLAGWGLAVVERHGNLLVCEAGPGVDPVAAAESVRQQRWVTYAEVDLVTMGTHPPEGAGTTVLGPASAPGPLQPALARIGAAQAWARGGSAGTATIAVLDDGCHQEHGAVCDHIVGRYDAITDSTLFATNPWDAHGTACAALAAGRDDAAGFRGVADGCGLLIVRIASRPGPGLAWATSSLAVSRGIRWAVQQRADVLSNSWGGGAPSNAIVDALEYARLAGRSGRGCVIVQAVGNNAGPVLFPATLDGVLAVSGTNLVDEFKTPTSSDGETWWGSCRGDQVDIAAPSVGLRTADTPGAPGESDGDYYARFNGTSGAAPLVAGAAAALLRVRPALTETELRTLLCDTAAKVGPLAYGVDRDEEYGYGRLDLAAALARIDQQAGGAVSKPPSTPGSADVQAGPPATPLVPTATGLLARLPLPHAVYTLAAADGRPAVVHAFAPAEALTVAQMQAADDVAFGSLAGQVRTLRYGANTSTPYGAVLWGATDAGASAGGDVPDGEVRLPRPEDDVFAQR